MLGRPRSKAAVRVSRPEPAAPPLPPTTLPAPAQNRWSVQARTLPAVDDNGETAAPLAHPSRLPRL